MPGNENISMRACAGTHAPDSRQIISASRRTDIPAFYSDWFINRIRAGSFVKVNPFNNKQRKTVSLLPEDVAAIVFWTKNPLPVMPHLPLLDERGYHYLFQFTLNNYAKAFEPSVPDLKDRIRTFKRLSDKIGPRRVLWRYDPIIVSSMNPLEQHLEQFWRLAKDLQGYTLRVTISLLALYDKVLANLKKLDSDHFTLNIKDMRAQENHDQLGVLAGGLHKIASELGIGIFSCSETADLKIWGIQPGSCIDVPLLNQLFQLDLKASKDKYQRPECGCAPSTDMGIYDTCKFGCIYCYANTSMKKATCRALKHNPVAPVLLD